MRIFHISDLHIGPEGYWPNDIDVRAHFLSLISMVDKLRPDHIVVTGDLCYRQGNKQTYEWISSCLAGTGIPFYTIPGNHDDAELMAEMFHGGSFPIQSGKLFYEAVLSDTHCLFLDTGDGRVGEMQLEWLRKKLINIPTGYSLIFMHHPPLLAGVPHMDDNYALEDRQAFLDLILEMGKYQYVFTGHYHVDKMMIRDHLSVFITPACFFQIDDAFREFHVLHSKPGFRIIDVDSNGINTQTHYII